MSQGFTKGTPIDTDPTLTANSDIVVPSQSAVKTYVASQVGTPVSSVTASAPIISSGGLTPNISIPAATTSANGYLTSGDWTNFNTAYTNRITSLTTTGTGAATLSANVLNIPTPTLTGLGATTVGNNFATLTNPSAITYPRINADNSVTALTVAQLKTDLSISSNITVVLGSNVTNVAALTVEDITGLSFVVNANKTYRWRATLLTSRTAGGSTGSFTINGPTFSTNGMAFRFTQTGTASTTQSNGQNSYNAINNATIANNAIVIGEGIVRTTASGTIQFRMYAAAAAMLTIQAGSYIEYSEIA